MLFKKSWNVLLGEDLPLFQYTSWEHIAGLAQAVKSHYLCEVLFTSLHIWKHFSLRLASVVEKFLSLFIKADWLYFPRLVTFELTTQRGKLDIYNSCAYLCIQSGRQGGGRMMFDRLDTLDLFRFCRARKVSLILLLLIHSDESCSNTLACLSEVSSSLLKSRTRPRNSDFLETSRYFRTV